MKKVNKGLVSGLAVAGLLVTGSAHAMVPVIDVPNLFVNKFNFLMLAKIRDELHDKTEGTVNNNTYNTSNNTANIDIKTSQLVEYNRWNYDIDNSFTWIINEGGGEIIPIPKVVENKMRKILDGKTVDVFTGQFKSAADYKKLPVGSYGNAAVFDGSRARKAANDTLVQAVESEQQAFHGELDALKALAVLNKETKGHGNQLQLANAFSASQINQMMKLRSMMLVSEAARATEAQVEADKDARAIAASERLQDGLKDAANQGLVPDAVY